MKPRTHRRLRYCLSGYADGELDTVTSATLVDHLRHCHRCRRELAAVWVIKGSLRRLGSAQPPVLAAGRLRRWIADPEAFT